LKEIKAKNELDFSSKEIFCFYGTVISIIQDGNPQIQKPFKANILLESSGETLKVCSWKFDSLPIYKELVGNTKVYKFEATTSVYNNEEQIRVGNIFPTSNESLKKIIRENVNAKNELVNLIETYIPSNRVIYRKLINSLVLENENFFKYPAASKMHHAFPGGLALHTLNVAKNALSIYNTYSGEKIDLPAILAGAILHDIGKLEEYNIDGSRRLYGDLIPHTISGYEKVILLANSLGINTESNMDIVILKHIILSHHEKLEFGAPVKPGTLEAIIVAKADALDAQVEAAEEMLQITNLNEMSEFIPACSTKIFKWNNN